MRQTDPLGHGQCWTGAEEPALRESSKKKNVASCQKEEWGSTEHAQFILSQFTSHVTHLLPLSRGAERGQEGH